MLVDCHTVGAPPQAATFPFEARDAPCTIFRFSAPWKSKPKLEPKLSSTKRHRSTADVDGEGSGCNQKKKRRLRLKLVTSRLSRPYATPTTYIASGGATKVVKMVRQRSGGGSLLRKAAIINLMRRRKAQKHGGASESKGTHRDEEPPLYTETEVEEMEDDGSLRQPPKPPGHCSTHIPRTPSPLGLSNYDAIDLEGDPYDDESWCDTPDDLVNSDFNKRDPVDVDHDEYGGFSSRHIDLETPQPRRPWSKDIMELVTDEDKQEEISFAQFN